MRRRQIYALRAQEEQKAIPEAGAKEEAPQTRATASIEANPKRAGRPKRVKHGNSD